MKCLVSCVTYEPARSRRLTDLFSTAQGGVRVVCSSNFTKVSANNAVPRWVVLLVKLLLDECGYVLFNVILLQSLHRAIRSHHSLTLMELPVRAGAAHWPAILKQVHLAKQRGCKSDAQASSAVVALPVLHSLWRPVACLLTCLHS